MTRSMLACVVSALLCVKPCPAQQHAIPAYPDAVTPSADDRYLRYLQIRAAGRQRQMSQYQAQAERGDMRAAATLAYMYRAGEQALHIAPDYDRARAWYAYAAQGGSANAAYNLAAFYLNGLGVARDKERAHSLLLWAAQHGDPASVRSLDLEGYDMRAERAKLDAQARAYAQSQQSIGNHSNSDDAAAGAAILLGLLMLSAVSNSVGYPADEDPRCRAWRQPQLVGAPAGATLPPGFSPASCH